MRERYRSQVPLDEDGLVLPYFGNLRLLDLVLVMVVVAVWASVTAAGPISAAWPARPKPVTSVQAVAPCRYRQYAASWFETSIDWIAPSTQGLPTQ